MTIDKLLRLIWLALLLETNYVNQHLQRLLKTKEKLFKVRHISKKRSQSNAKSVDIFSRGLKKVKRKKNKAQSMVQWTALI